MVRPDEVVIANPQRPSRDRGSGEHGQALQQNARCSMGSLALK